jgi:3-oxoadipate enol-lactonase
MDTVHRANSLEPLADGTVERWFTDAFKPRNPGRWKQIRDTVAATTPAGYLGCSAAIMNFDFTGQLSSLGIPVLVVCGADDPGTPASENRRIASLVPGGRYEEIPNARHFPKCRAPRGVQPDHDGLARRTAPRTLKKPRPATRVWPSTCGGRRGAGVGRSI